MTTMGLAECSIFPNADLNGELSLSQQSSSSSSFRQRDAASASTVRRHRKQRYTRSRTGCLTCRQRKVRCDQNRPLCENCQSLDRECVWRDPTSSNAANGQRWSRSREHDSTESAPQEPPTSSNTQRPAKRLRDGSPSDQPVSSGSIINHQRASASKDRSRAESSPLLASFDFNAVVSPSLVWDDIFDLITPSPANNSLAHHGTAFITDIAGEDANGAHRETSTMAQGVSSQSDLNTSDILGGNATLGLTAPSAMAMLARVKSSQAQAGLSLSQSTLLQRRIQPKFSPDLDSSLLAANVALTNPLLRAFESPARRRLFNHFLNTTSGIVVAVSAEKSKAQNPYLSVTLPMISLDVESPARNAFRLSVLSAGAAHLHHNMLRNGSPDAQDMLKQTDRLKSQAIAQMLLSLSQEGEAQVDMLLGACMTLKMRDVMMADRNWKQNLDFALRLIQKRGGPEEFIKADRYNFSRRFIVDQLATTDVFSTFTTGDEPVLLGPWAPWWFDSERNNQNGREWEAYERQFGVTRGMMELVARCRMLVYRKNLLADDLPFDTTMSRVLTVIQDQARSILGELSIWAVSQLDQPRKKRVRFGDSAYRYTMSIMLWTEVLGFPSAEHQVRSAVGSVLELCAEVSHEPVMLLWPIIIAGSRAVSPEHREWVRHLLDAFEMNHCYDLVTAGKLIRKQWERSDCGERHVPWPRLMRELDVSVLLL